MVITYGNINNLTLYNTINTQIGSAVALCYCQYSHSLSSLIHILSKLNLEKRIEYLKTHLFLFIQLRSDNNCYSLVGGAKESLECLENTAIREMEEETGISISNPLFLGLVSGSSQMITTYPDGNTVEGVDSLYLSITNNKKVIKTCSETKEFIWVQLCDIHEYLQNWHPAQYKTINEFLCKLPFIPEINIINVTKPNIDLYK